MSTHTLISIHHNTEMLTWLSVADNGQIMDSPHSGDLAQLADYAKQQSLILLAPTAQVLITLADVPKTALSKLRPAIPYAIEEELASPIEELHVALGDWENDSLAVAVIERKQLQTWLEQFRAHGLTLDVVLPNVYALEYQPANWSLYFESEFTLLRISPQLGLYIDHSNIETLFRALLNSDKFSPPEKVLVYSRTQTNLAALEKFNLVTEENVSPASLLELAAKNIMHMPAINLLQAEFKPKHKKTAKEKQWQLVGILAGAWLAILVLGNLGQYSYYSSKATQFNNQALTLYQQVFPNRTDLTIAKMNVTNELKNLILTAEGSPFLRLLARAGKPWSQNSNVTVTQLNYQQNKLTLQVTMPSFADLDQFVNQLNNQGLTVQQSNVRTAGKQIQAQLEIS